MKKSSSIPLRPRFQIDVEENIDSVRQKFVEHKTSVSAGIFMKIRNYHIQYTFSGERQKYWSPHLSIDLEEKEGNEKNATHIRGMYGPAQTLWTFFMFLHFIIAGVFILFMMFAISNVMIHKPFTNDIIVMTLMVFCWFLLYFIARQIRTNGYDQMRELEEEFNKIIP